MKKFKEITKRFVIPQILILIALVVLVRSAQDIVPLFVGLQIPLLLFSFILMYRRQLGQWYTEKPIVRRITLLCFGIAIVIPLSFLSIFCIPPAVIVAEKAMVKQNGIDTTASIVSINYFKFAGGSGSRTTIASADGPAGAAGVQITLSYDGRLATRTIFASDEEYSIIATALDRNQLSLPVRYTSGLFTVVFSSDSL